MNVSPSALIHDASSAARGRGGKKVIDTPGRRVALSANGPARVRAPAPARERFENKTRIDAGRRDEATTGQHAARIFVARESQSGLPPRLRLRLRLPPPRVIQHPRVRLILPLPSSREARRLHDETEVDEGRRARSRRFTGERNDSSRRRAVLPRTSHPWFPPALEPLNHSVVQRFEASVALNAGGAEPAPVVENDEASE